MFHDSSWDDEQLARFLELTAMLLDEQVMMM